MREHSISSFNETLTQILRHLFLYIRRMYVEMMNNMICLLYLLSLLLKWRNYIYPLINVINQAGTNQMKARAINNTNILVLLSLVGGPSNKTKYLSPSFPRSWSWSIQWIQTGRHSSTSLIADHWLVSIILLLARSHTHRHTVTSSSSSQTSSWSPSSSSHIHTGVSVSWQSC